MTSAVGIGCAALLGLVVLFATVWLLNTLVYWRRPAQVEPTCRLCGQGKAAHESGPFGSVRVGFGTHLFEPRD